MGKRVEKRQKMPEKYKCKRSNSSPMQHNSTHTEKCFADSGESVNLIEKWKKLGSEQGTVRIKLAIR